MLDEENIMYKVNSWNAWLDVPSLLKPSNYRVKLLFI